MKKYLSILFVCALVLSFGTSYVFAQTDGSATNLLDTNSAKNTIQAEKDKIRSSVEQIRTEAKQNIENLKLKIQTGKNKVKMQTAIERITGREDVLQKFDTAIEKLSTLKDNINTKITKLEAQDLNTDTAKAEVAIADEKITEAKGKMADMSTLLSTSANELSKDDKTTLKQLAEDVQNLVKDAHLALNEAVSSLKDELQNKINPPN